MKKAFLSLFFISLIYSCLDGEVSLNKTINKEDYYVQFLGNDIEIYRYNDETKMNGNFNIISNNVLMESFIVENGSLSGSYKTYYPNGKVATECNYRKGIKYGEETLYYSSGKIKAKSSYRKNNRNNEAITYYENGNVKSQTDSLGNTLHYSQEGDVFMSQSSNNNSDQNKIYRNGKLHMEEYEFEHSSGLINVVKFYNEDSSIKKIIGFRMEDENATLLFLDENHNFLDSLDAKKDMDKMMKLISELGPEMMR